MPYMYFIVFFKFCPSISQRKCRATRRAPFFDRYCMYHRIAQLLHPYVHASIGQKKWGGGLFAGSLYFRVTTIIDRRMLRGHAIPSTHLYCVRAMPVPLLSVRSIPGYRMGWQIDCYIPFLFWCKLGWQLGTCKN